MKLGLDTYSYHYAAGLWEYAPRENAPMTVAHFLRKAAELGLDGVQLCDSRHLDSLEYGYVSGLRERAESLGLYLELGTSGTNPEHLQNMVRAAHVLGSSIVRTFVGRPRPTTAQATVDLLTAVAADLAQVLPVCARYNVKLALENHQDLTAPELLQLLQLVGGGPLTVCFDTGNPLALLEDPLEAARLLAPHITSVHLKDYQVVATSQGFVLVGCALGEGVVELAAVIEVLSSHAPSATLNVESPVERHFVPALEEQHLQRLPSASARDLARTLRLVRDRGLPHMPVLPLDRGATEAEVLAEEDELVLRSVRWAQQTLNRPAAEPANAGG